MVNRGEDPERHFPPRLVVGRDPHEPWVVGVLARKAGVERRASLLEVLRHAAEDLRDGLAVAQASRSAV